METIYMDETDERTRDLCTALSGIIEFAIPDVRVSQAAAPQAFGIIRSKEKLPYIMVDVENKMIRVYNPKSDLDHALLIGSLADHFLEIEFPIQTRDY